MERSPHTSSFVLQSRDPVAFLAEHLRGAATRTLGAVDVAYTVNTIARELLPAAGFVGLSPQLRLFSDWIVHDKIDRSPAGQHALATIAEAIPQHGTEGHDETWLEEQLNDAVSFGALRLELLAACRWFRLPEDMFTSWDSWQRFAVPLAFEVSGRRIVLGMNTRASKEARARIDATSLDPVHRPVNLMIVFDADWKFWWRIETTGGVAIVIQTLFGGFRSEDFPVPPGWESPLVPGAGRSA